jgi:hypothetical protein
LRRASTRQVGTRRIASASPDADAASKGIGGHPRLMSRRHVCH